MTKRKATIKPAAKSKPAKAKKPTAKPAKTAAKPATKPALEPVVRASFTDSTEPVYADAVREQEARERYQKPFRKQFEQCKTLDKLAALVAKNRHTYQSVPWIAWICGGVPGEDYQKWSEKNDKTDNKKQKQLASIFEDLIVNGAELALVDETTHRARHALGKLLGMDELAVEQRLALLAKAIEHGADPADRLGHPLWASEDGPCLGYEVTPSALDVAVDDSEPRFLEAIKPHVSSGALEDAYLRNLVENVDNKDSGWAAKLERAGKLDRVITKLDSTDQAALVHFLCEAESKREYFDAAIERVDRGIDVNQPLPRVLTISVSTRWGVTPQLRIPAGAKPLDMVDSILGMVARAEAANAKKPDTSFRADNAKTIRELATHRRERLLALGATKSEAATQLDLPPILAATAEQVLRIAKLVGANDAPIRDAMAGIDTDGMGPWGFLRALVPAFESELVSDKLDAPLTRLLTAFTSDRWSNELRKSELPANKRAAVEIAIEFDDDQRMLAVKTNGGTQIWKLESDDVTVVAETVPAYLAAEIDRWQS